MDEQRPTLTPTLSGDELKRWYWLGSELTSFARHLGISTAGSKVELTDRIAAKLDGKDLPAMSRRPAGVKGLTGPLTPETLVPLGQRCSQHLREWLTEAVGPQFYFDGPMRDFIGGAEGQTLQDVVDFWHASRNKTLGEIEAQFELNRFSRAYRKAHRGASHSEMLEAWNEFKSLPIELRDTYFTENE